MHFKHRFGEHLWETWEEFKINKTCFLIVVNKKGQTTSWCSVWHQALWTTQATVSCNDKNTLLVLVAASPFLLNPGTFAWVQYFPMFLKWCFASFCHARLALPPNKLRSLGKPCALVQLETAKSGLLRARYTMVINPALCDNSHAPVVLPFHCCRNAKLLISC